MLRNLQKLRRSLAIRLLPPDLMAVSRAGYEEARMHAVILNRSANASGHLLSRAYHVGCMIRMRTTSMTAALFRSVQEAS